MHRSEEVSDRGVGGGCVLWIFAFVGWAMSFFLLLHERWGKGESDWSKSMQGERMPGRCRLTPSSLFLHLVCFLHSPSPSLFIISPNLPSLSSFLFHFGIWRHHRPLLAGTVSQSIQGIYQLLLNLLSNCQIPHQSCAHKHAHIHTLPGRVKQPLFSQKIGIKKEQKIPFRLEVEGVIINLSLCDGKMVNTCQNCLLRLQSMPSALLEVLQ